MLKAPNIANAPSSGARRRIEAGAALNGPAAAAGTVIRQASERAKSGGKRIDTVEDVLKIGRKVQVELKEIDPRGKLSLGVVEEAKADDAPEAPNETTPAAPADVDADSADAAAKIADAAGHMDSGHASDEDGERKPRQRRRGGRGRGRGNDAAEGRGDAASDQLVDAGDDDQAASATSEDA